MTLPHLTTLFDEAAGDPVPLPAAVAEAYGGLALPADLFYANFVATVDGVAAISEIPASSRVIGMGSPADRFLMALLRACADAVVIGAGTFREHSGPWRAEQVFPTAAEQWRQLREQLGLSPYPEQVVVSRSGQVTGPPEKTRDVVVVRSVPALVEHLRPHRRVLTEGGPHLMGALLETGLVDELFLTVSPVLAGSLPAHPGLAAAVALPVDGNNLELISARRAESHLFLRYARSERA